MEFVQTNQGQIKVARIAGDGNCLFGAICNQLFGLNIDSKQHKEKVRSLRREVVNYIRIHALEDRVKNCIICRTWDDLPHLSSSNYETQIREFTDFLSVEGNWGGEETVLAASNIFKTDIIIHFEKGNPIKVSPQNAPTVMVISIVYRLQDKNSPTLCYNHYDSLVELQTDETEERKDMSKPTFSNSQQTNASLPFVSLNSYNSDIQALQEEGQVNLWQLKVSTPKIDSKDPVAEISSWNVRGCNQPCKRSEIDQILNKEEIDLAFLQKTNLSPGMANTSHYTWHLISDSTQNTEHRGIDSSQNKSQPQPSKS